MLACWKAQRDHHHNFHSSQQTIASEVHTNLNTCIYLSCIYICSLWYLPSADYNKSRGNMTLRDRKLWTYSQCVMAFTLPRFACGFSTTPPLLLYYDRLHLKKTLLKMTTVNIYLVSCLNSLKVYCFTLSLNTVEVVKNKCCQINFDTTNIHFKILFSYLYLLIYVCLQIT